jgi:hypothetical protein
MGCLTVTDSTARQPRRSLARRWEALQGDTHATLLRTRRPRRVPRRASAARWASLPDRLEILEASRANYVEIADLDAGLKRATKRGAKVMNGPVDVPRGGRIAQLMDPQGARLALHQTARN